jgi:polysaccharide deacetylase family protein (PEP-CTERM system associated)
MFMLNALTIDLEDYFQVHAFSDVIRFEDWGDYESRIERNVDRILEILSEAGHNSNFKTQNSKLNNSVPSPQPSTKATFFVLGWNAERYSGLVQRIQKEGHEIACHGYAHKLIYTQSKGEFRQDIRKSKAILEDITGSEVIGYRAPSYSITNKSQWAFEVLLEEGFKYDSSIFPIHHDFYGLPTAPRFPFVISLNGDNKFEFSFLNVELNPTQNSTLITHNSQLKTQNSAFKPQSSVLEVNSLTDSLIHLYSGVSEPQNRSTAAPNSIIEFPISTVKLLGQNVPVSGGGYFRLLPYPIIRRALGSINQKENKPFIFYAHPWEFDTDQPRIKGVTHLSKFRHYLNLDKTEDRFRRLLKDFHFSSVRDILKLNNQLTQ